MERPTKIAQIADKPLPSFFTTEDVKRLFSAAFLDEEACRTWVLRMIHPQEIVRCPGCAQPLTDRALQRFWKAERIRCRRCGKFFTALTGTFFSGSRLEHRELVLLALYIGLGADSYRIAERLSVSLETVRLWRRKFQRLERLQRF